METLKFTILGLLLGLTSLSYSQSPVNMYETFESGAIPQGWNLTGFFVDNTMSHTIGGTYSARSSQGAPPQNNYLRSPKFSVNAGERIELRFFALRTGGGQDPWSSVRIKGATLDYSFDTVVISNTTWQAFNLSLENVPVSDSVYIYFYCNTNPGSQRAIFDDISIVKSVIVAGLPSEPTALTALANSSTNINLSWADNSTNETNFIIERRMEGSAVWNVIDTVGENIVTYSDNPLNANTIYHYRVYANNIAGNSPYSNIASDTTFAVTGIISNSNTHAEYNLYNNYPNPFNPSTKIKFDLPNNANVKLLVYDINGREVASIINKGLLAGSYEYNFDAAALSSGIYFYSLITDSFIDTKKMILIK